MIEELSSDQLYAILLCVLSKVGPVGLSKELIDDVQQQDGLSLCMAGDDENGDVTFYAGFEDEELGQEVISSTEKKG